MYSFKQKDIIQDFNIPKLSAWDNFTQKIYEVFKNTKQACINLKERYDHWYSTYDFALAGHKTAWFIKYSLVPVLLWLFIFTMILITLSYVVIQFEFATTFGPENIVTWIKGIDKSKLPLLFQEKQGHPILLFIIWCVMFKCLFKYLCSLKVLFKKDYKKLFWNIPSYIQTLVLICMINCPYIYWVVGIYTLFLLTRLKGDNIPESHGYNVYDKDGNHIGSFERF